MGVIPIPCWFEELELRKYILLVRLFTRSMTAVITATACSSVSAGAKTFSRSSTGYDIDARISRWGSVKLSFYSISLRNWWMSHGNHLYALPPSLLMTCYLTRYTQLLVQPRRQQQPQPCFGWASSISGRAQRRCSSPTQKRLHSSGLS